MHHCSNLCWCWICSCCTPTGSNHDCSGHCKHSSGQISQEERYNDVIVHRFILTGYNLVTSTSSTANNEEPYYSTVNSEQPYYSTVSAQQPDAIEMKDNDAYVKPPPAQREIIVEENPAYTVTVQNFTRNAP